MGDELNLFERLKGFIENIKNSPNQSAQHVPKNKRVYTISEALDPSLFMRHLKKIDIHTPNYRKMSSEESLDELLAKRPSIKDISALRRKLFSNNFYDPEKNLGVKGPFVGVTLDLSRSHTKNNFLRNRGRGLGSRIIKDIINPVINVLAEKYGGINLNISSGDDLYYILWGGDCEKNNELVRNELLQRTLNAYNEESYIINGRLIPNEGGNIYNMISKAIKLRKDAREISLDLIVKYTKKMLPDRPKGMSAVDFNNLVRERAKELKIDLDQLNAERAGFFTEEIHKVMNKIDAEVKTDVICRLFKSPYFENVKRGKIPSFHTGYIHYIMNTEFPDLNVDFLHRYISFWEKELELEDYLRPENKKTEMAMRDIGEQLKLRKPSLMMKAVAKLRNKNSSIFAYDFVRKVMQQMVERLESSRPKDFYYPSNQYHNLVNDMKHSLARMEQYKELGDIRNIAEEISEEKERDKKKLSNLINKINKNSAIGRVGLDARISLGPEGDEIIYIYGTSDANVDGVTFGDTARLGQVSKNFETYITEGVCNKLKRNVSVDGGTKEMSFFYISKMKQFQTKDIEEELDDDEDEGVEVLPEDETQLMMKYAKINGIKRAESEDLKGIIPADSPLFCTFLDKEGKAYSANSLCDIFIEDKEDIEELERKARKVIDNSLLKTNATIYSVNNKKLEIHYVAHEKNLINQLIKDLNSAGIKSVYAKKKPEKEQPMISYATHIKKLVNGIKSEMEDALSKTPQWINIPQLQQGKFLNNKEGEGRLDSDKNYCIAYVAALIAEIIKSDLILSVENSLNSINDIKDKVKRDSAAAFVDTQLIPEIKQVDGEGLKSLVISALNMNYGKMLSGEAQKKVSSSFRIYDKEKEQTIDDLALIGSKKIASIPYLNHLGVARNIRMSSTNFLGNGYTNISLEENPSDPLNQERIPLHVRILKAAEMIVGLSSYTRYKGEHVNKEKEREILDSIGSVLDPYVGKIALKDILGSNVTDDDVRNSFRRNTITSLKEGEAIITIYSLLCGNDVDSECRICSSYAPKGLIDVQGVNTPVIRSMLLNNDLRCDPLSRHRALKHYNKFRESDVYERTMRGDKVVKEGCRCPRDSIDDNQRPEDIIGVNILVS